MLKCRASKEPSLAIRPPPNLPSAARLEAAALHLAERGDLRSLVGLVERWSQLGDPTPQARLAQIEGFLKLCMMDRAWTRLKSMPVDGPWHVESLLLTARMFIDRGWPARARKVLDDVAVLAPAHPDLPSLRTEAAAAPRRAPPDPPDSGVPVEVRIAAAEVYLATGAYLRAKRVLDQLGRTDPDHPRVDDLQWALQGDYELSDDSLKEIVDRCVPASGPGGEGRPVEGPPPAVDTGPTVGRYDGGTGNFPSLFEREHDHDHGQVHGDAEDTQATHLRDLKEAAATRAAAEERDEDTQILRIVETSQAHERPPAEAHGEPPTSPGLADELEREDDAVVQFTRSNGRQPPHQTMVPTRVTHAPPRPLPPRPAVGARLPMPERPAIEPIEDDDRMFWMLAVALVLLGGSGLLFGFAAAWSAGMFG